MDAGWTATSIVTSLVIAFTAGTTIARKGTVKKGECEERHKATERRFESGEKKFNEVNRKLDALGETQTAIREDIAALLAVNGIKRDKGG